MKPLKIEDIVDQEVQTLSGGELQRVAIVLALGIPADIYLIDEPSAYLDSNNVLFVLRLSEDSFCMPRRPLLLSSTISLWPPI